MSILKVDIKCDENINYAVDPAAFFMPYIIKKQVLI